MTATPGPTVRELLVASTAKHRKTVARALGLRADAAATAIAAALCDDERLTPIVAGLESPGRAAATAGAFAAPGTGLPAGPRHDTSGARELERHGLAYAFGNSWARLYLVPEDLRPVLQRVRAAAHARRAPEDPGAAARFVGAPLQIAHDAAVLSAYMAREPVRVKADGEIYARVRPKLEGGLAPVPGLDGAAGLAPVRVELALDWLRRAELLRLRVDDLPGRDQRRELVPAGDLAGAVSADPGVLRDRLADDVCRYEEVRGLRSLIRALDGRSLALEALGGTLQALLEEARVLGHRQLGAVELALTCAVPLWLAGELELGVDAAGAPVSARVAPRDAPAEDAAPLGVAQANFEIVLLRRPAPAERFTLELCCERTTGQEHVFALTRAASRAAQRAGAGPGGVAGALSALMGELPQNVERSLRDWTRDVRVPLRLRSALFVDAGDEAAAESLAAGALAGLVVERLGGGMLAVSARRLEEVARALAGTGDALEPGLERVSGTWQERTGPPERALRRWAPDLEDERVRHGAQVSTIDEPETEPEPRASGSTAGRRAPDPDGPLGLILQALEEDSDVAIVYAGARGVSHRVITPYDVDDARVHAYCHLRDDERSFWLSSILAAAAVPD